MQKQKLNKRRYLGSLCHKKHRYGYESTDSRATRTTNQSVRYKGCNTCCVCNAISVEKRKKQQKKYRDKHKEKMKKYQKDYRMAHEKDYRADYHHAYYMNVTKQILQSEREHHNYYINVTKPKRKRERHNKNC